MNKIICIIKNNYLRALANKNQIIVVLLMSFFSILFAVYFTSKLEVKANIAVVTSQENFQMDSKYIKFKILEKEPAKSELVMNKYDAIVFDRGNGKFDIKTLKSKSFEQMLRNALKDPSSFKPLKSERRGVGTNILGYLIMFILLQGLMFMNFFSEDKQIRTLKRVAISPASIGGFLVAHGLFNYIMVYIPTFLVLIISREVLKINIGFSYLQYTFLLGLITLLSTAFALFVSSIVEKVDNVSTAGATIIVLTSLLSGSFYSFNNKNVIFNGFVSLLPQKNFMSLVQGIEQGNSFVNYLPQFSYIIILSLALFVMGSMICKKRFNEGRY